MTPIVSATILRTQTDARLLSLVRDGHDVAFEAIVERYRRPLLRYCRRFLPEERAEDVVQQTFLSTWSSIRAGTEVSDLRAWLYRLTRNAALDVAKRAGYDYAELTDALSLSPAAEKEVERRWVMRETLSGIAALPDNQREALLRTVVEGQSRAEIARELAVSEGAVRQLVHRARSALRAAATAVTPMPLAAWIAGLGSAGSGQTATRIAELVAEGGLAGGTAVLVKTGTAVVAAGAIAVGAATQVDQPASKADDAAASEVRTAGASSGRNAAAGSGTSGSSGSRDSSGRSRGRSGHEGDLREDNRGPGSANSGPDSSSSGPGGGGGGDSSGPGSGGAGSRSGSSGSGSGSSGSGSSGSGSSGSSGQGSGSSGSGSSGSGGSGSGSGGGGSGGGGGDNSGSGGGDDDDDDDSGSNKGSGGGDDDDDDDDNSGSGGSGGSGGGKSGSGGGGDDDDD